VLVPVALGEAVKGATSKVLISVVDIERFSIFGCLEKKIQWYAFTLLSVTWKK
jgi:hypothetical protein